MKTTHCLLLLTCLSPGNRLNNLFPFRRQAVEQAFRPLVVKTGANKAGRVAVDHHPPLTGVGAFGGTVSDGVGEEEIEAVYGRRSGCRESRPARAH